MKGTEFLLGILGLTRVERMTIASVCSLTHNRPRGYTVLAESRGADADIMLVDADDRMARDLWEESTAHLNGRPALMISRDPTRVVSPAYSLLRTNFASKLIRILDQITIHEFKFLPELIVSDQSSVDPTLELPAPNRELLAATGTPRVLVVDDSVVVRTRMRTLLELHGLRVDLVEDAESGLACARENRYQVIFLDVMMPGMDGYTACRRLKSDRNAPPIVLLTSRDSPFDKIRGVMAGCSRYLTKPITVDDLHKLLQEFALERPVALDIN